MSAVTDILVVEPFYGGSHAQLINLLLSDDKIGPRCEVVTMPAKKWHWRARTSALYLSQIIPVSSYRVIFTSSVLNLAELIALRSDLAFVKKIVYFHENQLVYPVRKVQDRDFQYGYNQILTSLVADVVVFNSSFNMESFLSSISLYLKLIPDHRPKKLEAVIRQKCSVLYFPVCACSATCDRNGSSENKITSDFQEYNERTLINNTKSSTETEFVSDHDAVNVEAVANSPIKVHDTGSRDLISESRDHNVVNVEAVTDCGNELSISPSKGLYTDSRDLTSESSDSKSWEIERDRICPAEKLVTEIQHQSAPEPAQNCFISDIFETTKSCLHIVWPHRWEHDKDPDTFFKTLLQLQNEGLDFCVSVIGETFTDVPEIFHTVKSQLESKIVAWGYQTKQNYQRILKSADVVVSTALHEFFGVSMLEAVNHGCYPLCPKRLVYPEIYPEECLYSTQAQLAKRLRRFCLRPDAVKTDKFKVLVESFSWKNLQDKYRKLLLQKDECCLVVF